MYNSHLQNTIKTECTYTKYNTRHSIYLYIYTIYNIKYNTKQSVYIQFTYTKYNTKQHVQDIQAGVTSSLRAITQEDVQRSLHSC